MILLAAAFASYSNALALLLRSQESVIGAVNFVVLPLSFLSSMLVPTGSLPGWIAAIARWNPVDWAVAVGRQTLRRRRLGRGRARLGGAGRAGRHGRRLWPRVRSPRTSARSEPVGRRPGPF